MEWGYERRPEVARATTTFAIMRRMSIYETVTFDRAKFTAAHHRLHADVRRYFANRPADLLDLDLGENRGRGFHPPRRASSTVMSRYSSTISSDANAPVAGERARDRLVEERRSRTESDGSRLYAPITQRFAGQRGKTLATARAYRSAIAFVDQDVEAHDDVRGRQVRGEQIALGDLHAGPFLPRDANRFAAYVDPGVAGEARDHATISRSPHPASSTDAAAVSCDRSRDQLAASRAAYGPRELSPEPSSGCSA